MPSFVWVWLSWIQNTKLGKIDELLCEKTDSANWTLEVGQDINMQGMMEKQSSFEEPRPSWQDTGLVGQIRTSSLLSLSDVHNVEEMMWVGDGGREALLHVNLNSESLGICKNRDVKFNVIYSERFQIWNCKMKKENPHSSLHNAQKQNKWI